MASRQTGVTQEEARTAVARVILEHLREDTYPSWTQIRLLEQCIPASLQREYLNILLEKVIAENYPSTSMLRHLVELTGKL